MPSISEMASNVFILDNGGSSIKAGFSTDSEPRVIPNSVMKSKSERRRQFIGSQIDECKDFAGLYYIYPCQRGYIVNWDLQRQVWDHVFGSEQYNVDFKETCLLATEPYFDFASMQEKLTEIFFEDYNFHSILRVNPATLSAYKAQKLAPSEMCCLVVDSGFSFTHLIPYIKGKKLGNPSCRINVGGKLLTNHLKEITSYRQLNVLDETYVMNQVKEDVCYVSTDFWSDMLKSRKRNEENTIVRDYVLPDYTVIKRGYVKPPEDTSLPGENEQIVRMNLERFMVPEIMFHPPDVFVKEMGISEAIMHCIGKCPDEVQPHLYKNIILTGGNACFSGFKERIFNDIRSEAQNLFDVNITLPENPVTDAWEGGALMADDIDIAKLIVTRRQYEEHGISICNEKFDI